MGPTRERNVNNPIKVTAEGVVNWVKVRWKDIQVGDILKITSSRQFPADLILLASSEPKGMAYIETSNLDGETNLKLKQGTHVPADYTRTVGQPFISLSKLDKGSTALQCHDNVVEP